MAYDIRFVALSGSDWAEIVEAINDDTNQPLSDIDTALIELSVRDRDGCPVLSASTADDTITIPETGKFSWRFTKDQMSGLCPGNTYQVGCRITPDAGDGTTALFSGSLAYLNGDIR